MTTPTETLPVRAFIQARMSSSRFPGKVLAPFLGRPMIDHVVASVSAAISPDAIVVLTSTDKTDDPLAAYGERQGWKVFRGPLDNVFERFRLCAERLPCDWILRVCADSPLLDPELARSALRIAAEGNWDVVTNVFPPTFPTGQSVEVVRVELMMAVDADRLSPDDLEHVTRFFYGHPEEFRILNLQAGEHHTLEPGCAVDTIEDLRRLERTGRPPRLSFAPSSACGGRR